MHTTDRTIAIRPPFRLARLAIGIGRGNDQRIAGDIGEGVGAHDGRDLELVSDLDHGLGAAALLGRGRLLRRAAGQRRLQHERRQEEQERTQRRPGPLRAREGGPANTAHGDGERL